jgi:hypothetical protein
MRPLVLERKCSQAKNAGLGVLAALFRDCAANNARLYQFTRQTRFSAAQVGVTRR